MPEPQPVPVVAQAAIVRHAHGGRAKPTVLVVAEPDPAKAREILRGKLPGFHVDELYPLPVAAWKPSGSSRENTHAGSPRVWNSIQAPP
jgi:hypothetical protein